MAFPNDNEEEDDFLTASNSEEEFDDGLTEEETREIEASNDSPPETYAAPQSAPRRRRMVDVPTNGAAQANPKTKVRTRPMPQNLRLQWPDVCSMLITNANGSQIFFVR
jgi:hypothetical protein